MSNTILDSFKNHLSCERFLFEIDTGKKCSYRDLHRLSRERAVFLSKSNQKIITVVLPNSIDYVSFFLASLMTNAIFNPIPYFIGVPELERILDHIEPAHLITDRQDIQEKFKSRFSVISLQQTTSEEFDDVSVVYPSHSIACLYYSSGTTGNPKGVLYSHHNMISLINSLVRGFRFTKDDNHLAFLPFGHTASINYNILPALACGANLFISRGFEALRHHFFDVLSHYQITYTQIVPTVLFMLSKLNFDITHLDLHRLKYIGCGSSPLPLEAQKEFIAKYNIKVANLYGLSETGPSHVDDPCNDAWHPGSIGIPLDVNKCRLAADGEILLKGDNVFVGYYKNPKAYSEVVKDGWFHTGDLGYEKEGKFFYLDRKKDIIIKGGINILPAEVEEILYSHKNVLECVVTSKINELFGEEIVAVVVPKIMIQEEKFVYDLKQICKQKLSSFKVPSQIIVWSELPKTASKKIMRRAVREAINSTANATVT